ncbi:MAG: YggS family pyridoxal phosphate-dependent enzyme [Spirochaetales bacterium]|jgi:pyridoxal phosphate enzyme (YggS family)|nr:YggS family pyridoxal phosphate-dependent enzyme [Exilispira sp.]NMC67116.1 YggS family pyridoxal phosphate-dependent enzyme [Spirochaetales bacterium]
MKERIEKLLEEIENLSTKGNFKEKITLVAVTKTFDVDTILEAYRCGLRIFGENKVQEAISKIDAMKDYKDIQWHLIGHLQSNKVKKCKVFSLIHSIDSIKLLEEFLKFEDSERPDLLIQINSSAEESKSGIPLENVYDFFDKVLELELNKKIKIRGLMTIGPLTEDKKEIRIAFKKTRKFYEDLQYKYNLTFDILSMGMSSDYRIAIEEGSNMIRIGSLIFGERKYV